MKLNFFYMYELNSQLNFKIAGCFLFVWFFFLQSFLVNLEFSDQTCIGIETKKVNVIAVRSL